MTDAVVLFGLVPKAVAVSSSPLGQMGRYDSRRIEVFF